jgi:hypothetical protein
MQVIIARYRTRHCVSHHIYCPYFEWRHGLLSSGLWSRVTKHSTPRCNCLFVYGRRMDNPGWEVMLPSFLSPSTNFGMVLLPPTSFSIRNSLLSDQETLVKLVFVGHLWSNSKQTNLYRWWTYGKHLTQRKLNSATISCANVQFRVQSWAVKLEGWYISLPIKGEFKNNNQLPLENYNVLCIFVENEWRLSGKQVVMRMNDFGQCSVCHKNYTSLQVGQNREVKLTQKA